MTKSVLWIDDSAEERAAGEALLRGVGGITPRLAASSDEARRVLETIRVDAVITDILRRRPDRSVAADDGYRFFREYIRRRFPTLPVLFHTKNLPSTFDTDEHSQYLSKWEPPAKKAIELEVRLTDTVRLYEAYADWATWQRIEPRLVEVTSKLLDRLRAVDDIWRLTPDQFEQLVGELLARLRYSVLWVPGGKDGGIDIVASSGERDFLIDVKRYRASEPVSVELVRSVYGVAESISPTRPGRIVHGGIITSSRFTKEVEIFRQTVRRRPLLRDGDWLRTELAKFVPRTRFTQHD
ncbi:restriction endonuclease [bacterium]|nr:restriction endonuclease [bacterium]